MKETYRTFYVINVVFQSIFTLIWQILAAVLISYLSVKFLDAPTWIYVPIVLLGVGSGLVSMIKFVLAAMHSLEGLDRAAREKQKAKEKENEK